MKRRIFLLLSIATVLALGSIYAWHKSHPAATVTAPAGSGQRAGDSQSRDTATPSNPTPPATGTQPNTTAPAPYVIRVYFSKHPVSDNDPSAVFAVHRETDSIGVARFAVAQTLQGPTTAEQQAGYFTTARLRNDASNCGNQDFTITITGGIATLQFCRSFDHRGVVSDGQAKSELTATLQQFSSVNKVIILNKSGHCEFDLSGMDLCKQ